MIISKYLRTPKRTGQRGAVIVLVAILGVVFVGFAALAIDLSHLYVVRNELQNAADAGALAGARVLYNAEGTAINLSANQEAKGAAIENKAISKDGNISVEVNFTSGNGNWLVGDTGDVQIGHWSFGLGTLDKGFYPYKSAAGTPPSPITLANKSKTELDEDKNFINAIKVVARRQDSPAASFFARIFGFDDFLLSADAVGYIGFSGSLLPKEVDLPIAMCKQSLLNTDNEYTCSVGRMLNSGKDPAQGDYNTGGWTNLTQAPDTTATPGDLQALLESCSEINSQPVTYGVDIGVGPGVSNVVLESPNKPDLMGCWNQANYDTDGDGIPDSSLDTDGDGVPDMPWSVTLPVINCEKNNVSNPSTPVGAVTMEILWIFNQAQDNQIDVLAPKKMLDWSSNDASGIVRWDSFVSHFEIQLPDGENTFVDATYANGGYQKMSIYFKPSCQYQEPSGVTGGENFGVLAKIPVLVE